MHSLLLIIIVKTTPTSEKYTNPIIIIDNNGLSSDFGKLSDNISKNTIILNKIVTANDIRSPDSNGIINVNNISVAVENVGIIIFKL